jgi:hypothetical protein
MTFDKGDGLEHILDICLISVHNAATFLTETYLHV